MSNFAVRYPSEFALRAEVMVFDSLKILASN